MAEPVVAPVIPVVKTEEERQAEAVAAANAHRDAAVVPDVTPDAIVGTPADVPVKPEHVPEKFWNAEKGEVNHEAWAKAHTDLETKFHTETPAAAPAEGDAPKQQTAVDAARNEYAEKGTLADTTYESLKAVGMDRATVDSYIAGVIAQSAETNKAAFEAADGEENYGKMVEWAGESLTPAEIKAFNLQVSSNDAEVIAGAVKGLYAKYGETAPVEADRVGGTGTPVTTGMFESKVEMTTAMNVPNPNVPGKTMYETDPAFRAEVHRKMQASRKAGKNIFV